MKVQEYQEIISKKRTWLAEMDTCMEMFHWCEDEKSRTNDFELLTILDRHSCYWYNRFHKAWNENPRLAHYYNENSRWFRLQTIN